MFETIGFNFNCVNLPWIQLLISTETSTNGIKKDKINANTWAWDEAVQSTLKQFNWLTFGGNLPWEELDKQNHQMMNSTDSKMSLTSY